MGEITYTWTSVTNSDFQMFYQITEDYYSSLVGGVSKRKGFVPYNASAQIPDVLIAYDDGKAVGCAGLKRYDDKSTEIKRVWVQSEYRRQHIAGKMMQLVEQKAKKQGFARVILQTRPQMTEAVGMYTKRGYKLIENYPPYDKLVGAVCYAKEL
ncbi:MAG: GNAT family N-acetyltransferase [Ruminococcus sp.]|nr:GNAT family N-acetyltransferase [Ruminococcus sp.]